MAEINEQTALHLLDNVTIIRNKYDEIAKVTGENFNIFSILHLESDEVRLHSRLIGELLNPKGSHNQNELFLKLFVASIGLEKQYSDEQLKRAKVFIEKNIGEISDDYTKGGRIDLVLSFPGNKEIVIENKIWANDQPYQLARYYNQYPNSYIIYLTPFGTLPSPSSLGVKSDKTDETNLTILDIKLVKCLSYQLEIKSWLEQCLKEVPNMPLIREVLNHYIILINGLTNQSRNKDMSKQIEIKLLNSKDAFISAELIQTTIQKIKNDAEILFWEELNKNSRKITDWKEYQIKYGFGDDGGLHHLFYAEKNGIRINQMSSELDELYSILKTINNNFKRTNSCLVWTYSNYNFTNLFNTDAHKYTDQNNRESLIKEIVFEGEIFIKEIIQKIG